MRILVTGMGGPAGRAAAELLIARVFEVVGVDVRTVAFHQLDDWPRVSA